jgi:hypothetical protein
MVQNISPDILREYPSELVQFAADEAERGANEVIEMLSKAGLAPSPGETRGLPAGILLDLGAVAQLRRWESAGYKVHLHAGLPSARVALECVIITLEEAATTPISLARAGLLARLVFDVGVTQFAWGGPSILGTQVALDTSDEDAFVEAMAQFLWAHRHCASSEKKGTQS